MHEKLYSTGIPTSLPSSSFEVVELTSNRCSIEALETKLGSMTVSQKEKADKDLAKKQVKEAARLERVAAAKASSIITIKRVERTKRKHVVIVSGLEAFPEIDIKKLAKEFGKKFACGSSVTKSAAGEEEITVQGDVSEEIFDELTEKHGVDENNVKQVEEKKKKGGE